MELTGYEKWKSEFHHDQAGFREKQKEEQIFQFDKVVIKLQKLQNHMNCWDLEDLFGEQIGRHLWQKFVKEHNRNILSWFNKLTNEYRFFIITVLNNGSKWS